MLSHLQLFELLTLLTALRCCAGLPWDWLLCEHECLCDAAQFLIMGGDELSSYRAFFHPLEGSSSEATLILSLESERFELLTPSVLGLFWKLWNGSSVCGSCAILADHSNAANKSVELLFSVPSHWLKFIKTYTCGYT